MYKLNRWRMPALARRFLLVLGSAVLATSAGAQSIYPHAQAAINAQHLATAIESAFAPFAPVVPTLFGHAGGIEYHRFFGRLFRALDAYTLAERHLQRANAMALATGNATTAAETDIARGEIALVTGHYDRADRISRSLTQLATEAQLPWAAATAEEYLGVVDRRRGNLDSAAEHERRALDLQRALANPVGVATALSNLGTLARDRGDYAGALDLFMQALAIREKTRNELELTLRNLALIYRDLGDDATTRKYFERALKVAAEHGDNTNYAATLGTWAGYLVDVGDYTPALAAAEESLAMSRASGNRPAIGFDLLDGGRALVGLGRLDEAEARLQEALTLGRELDQHEIVAHSLIALAEIALQRGDRTQAGKLLDAMLADPQATQYKPFLVEVDALRERLATANGKPALALDYAHKVAALREELLGTRASRRLAALESQAARAVADQKLALVTKDSQLQTERLTQLQLRRKYAIAALVGLSALAALLAWRFVGVRRLNRALAARNAQIESQRVALSAANDRLRQQTDELYQAAITDPLTGVFNRGHLLRQLDARIDECQRQRHELAVLLIDFDHFKQINDAHGHLFGDRVLVAGVQTLRQWLEPGDLLGRYGGEEFLVAVSGRELPAIRELAERLRERVAETMALFAADVRPAPTISIGIGLLSRLPPDARIESLIEAADTAVYAAKAAGRNRVVMHAADRSG
jgi:diguanylate cyclase (GGDEF)-like protein